MPHYPLIPGVVMSLLNLIPSLVADGHYAAQVVLVQKFIGTAALCIILNEDDVAFVWRAADVEDMLLLAGLVISCYLEGVVLMLLNQKELLRFCRHLPAQVYYVYFTFHLLKLDGYGKPTHLEHYPHLEHYHYLVISISSSDLSFFIRFCKSINDIFLMIVSFFKSCIKYFKFFLSVFSGFIE